MWSSSALPGVAPITQCNDCALTMAMVTWKLELEPRKWIQGPRLCFLPPHEVMILEFEGDVVRVQRGGLAPS